MRKVILIVLFMMPALVQAKPWCLVSERGSLCNYNTADECYKNAGRKGGYCRQNPSEVGMSGIQAYCLLTSARRQCDFRTMRSCMNYMNKFMDNTIAGCVENTEKFLNYAAIKRAQGQKNKDSTFTDMLGMTDFEAAAE